MARTKKQKLRCKNCGDETIFPANADFERSKKGWCVSCYKQWFKYGQDVESYDPDHGWKETRNLYGKTSYDSRASGNE